MDNLYKIVLRDLDNKYIVEKVITLRLPDEKLKELRDIAREIDDNTEEVINTIIEHNLLDNMDDKNFKQLVVDAYYSEMFEI